MGGVLCIPDFGDNRPEGATDFNDLARLYGIEAVKRLLLSAPDKDKRPHRREIDRTLHSLGNILHVIA